MSWKKNDIAAPLKRRVMNLPNVPIAVLPRVGDTQCESKPDDPEPALPTDREDKKLKYFLRDICSNNTKIYIFTKKQLS